MSGSFDTGIPNITVVLRENTDINKVVLGIPNLNVNIQQGDSYNVLVQPSDLVVYRTGSLPSIAISAYSASHAVSASNSNTATTASYALVAQSLLAGSTIEYLNFSASNDAYIGHTLTVGTSATIPSITGSITNAVSASHALTASYVEGDAGVTDWSEIQNKPTGLISSSVQASSWTVATASVAVTASYSLNVPTIDTGSFATTGSNIFVGDQQITGSVTLNGGNVEITSSKVTDVYSATALIDPLISMTKYSATTIDYTAQRNNEIRSGIILASWSGSSVTYTDVSNSEINGTGDLNFNFIRIGDNIRFRAYSAGIGTGNWSIHFLIKLFPNLLI